MLPLIVVALATFVGLVAFGRAQRVSMELRDPRIPARPHRGGWRSLLRGRREERVVLAALPEFLDAVVGELRAGATTQHAIATYARVDGPLAPQLQRIVRAVDLGDDLTSALRRWAQASRVPDERAVAGGIAAIEAAGGPRANGVAALARQARDRAAVRSEIRSQTAQARVSASVVAVLPLIGLSVGFVADPRTVVGLVTMPLGRLCLVIGASMNVAGFVWMRHLVRVPSS